MKEGSGTMRTLLFVGMALTLVFGFSTSAEAGDCCMKAKAENGACCGTAYFAGQQIKSAKLHKALAGKKVEGKKIECGGCEKALAKNSSCHGCKVHFAKGKAYRSPVAQALALGHAIPADHMKCGGCKEAAKSNGKCEGCKVQFVGNLAFKSEKHHAHALKAAEMLEMAIKASANCEDCAVGIVTNGKCDGCKVAFKNGKMTKV